VPLAVQTSPANEPDGKNAIALLDRLPAVAGRRGRPRGKPDRFQGDAAYGTAANIRQVVRRGIQSLLAPYGKSKHEHGSGLGKTRYVIERTLAWFGNYRRLKQCYERAAAHFQAFHDLAASLICFKKLSRTRK
jgi:transposase